MKFQVARGQVGQKQIYKYKLQYSKQTKAQVGADRLEPMCSPPKLIGI
jgi:hypothetical protein